MGTYLPIWCFRLSMPLGFAAVMLVVVVVGCSARDRHCPPAMRSSARTSTISAPMAAAIADTSSAAAGGPSSASGAARFRFLSPPSPSPSPSPSALVPPSAAWRPPDA